MYTHTQFRKILVKWIINDDQPFTLPEAEDFREMIHMFHAGAEIPSAGTIRRDIDRLFVEEICYGGRRSFAVDAWTSPNMRATVHWVDAVHRLLMDTGENLCREAAGWDDG
jgi:hypothetical protein